MGHAFLDGCRRRARSAAAVTLVGSVFLCAAASAPTATGGFTVANGQIVDPHGRAFIARGINIADWAAVQGKAAGGSNNGALILSLFPGINMVRLNLEAHEQLAQAFGNCSAASVRPFVTTLTNAGVVVEIEDHTSLSGVRNVPTGAAFAREMAWYASMATAYAGNPYVWFGTMNEPDGTMSAIIEQQVATYRAVRDAGSKSPVLMQAFGAIGAIASPYAAMHNIVWDQHFYADPAINTSNDIATIAALLATWVGLAQSITSADGTVPAIIGEYGISESGERPDPTGRQILEAVQQSGFGTAAWTWSAGASDKLVSNGALTSYGQEVAAFIAGRPTAGFSVVGP